MFEKLIDLLTGAWERLSPVLILNQYEVGVRLRLGKLQKEVKPGLVWKIPVIDHILKDIGVLTTNQLQAQTLTTADDKCIVISSVVTYSIHNPKKYLLSIWDGPGVLSDTVLCVIKQTVADHPYKDLNSPDIEALVLRKARKALSKHGISIKNITFSDFGGIKTLRLLSNDFMPSDHAG